MSSIDGLLGEIGGEHLLDLNDVAEDSSYGTGGCGFDGEAAIADVIWHHPSSSGKLWLGGVDACAVRWLVEKNIKLVITALTKVHRTARVQNWASSNHLEHLTVEVKDRDEDSQWLKIKHHLPALVSKMESVMSGGGNILVHCHAGINRSATIVAGFICCSVFENYRSTIPRECLPPSNTSGLESVNMAKKLIQRRRPAAGPHNPSFVRGLMQYMNAYLLQKENGANAVDGIDIGLHSSPSGRTAPEQPVPSLFRRSSSAQGVENLSPKVKKAISSLVDMGFRQARAEQAAQKCQGDVQAAVLLLTGGIAGGSSPTSQGSSTSTDYMQAQISSKLQQGGRSASMPSIPGQAMPQYSVASAVLPLERQHSLSAPIAFIRQGSDHSVVSISRQGSLSGLSVSTQPFAAPPRALPPGWGMLQGDPKIDDGASSASCSDTDSGSNSDTSNSSQRDHDHGKNRTGRGRHKREKTVKAKHKKRPSLLDVDADGNIHEEWKDKRRKAKVKQRAKAEKIRQKELEAEEKKKRREEKAMAKTRKSSKKAKKSGGCSIL